MPGGPPDEPRRRAAAILVPLALIASGLAGCLGDDADPPAVSPRPAAGDFGLPPDWRTLEDGPRHENRNPEPDRRLRVDAPWQEGDWWYWTSNHSNWYHEEVSAIVDVNGTSYYKLVTETGEVGRDGTASPRVKNRVTEWITEDFRVVNRTNPISFTTYEPAYQLRFLPGDGTHRWNATLTPSAGALAGSTFQISYSERVVEAWPLTVLQTPTGPVNASHFRVTTDIRHDEGQQFEFTERWYSPDLGNDAQRTYNARSEDAERLLVIGYHVNGVTRGQEPPT